MFGKKKAKPEIDKEQLELIQNAQQRIKQKKRLYVHFVIFLIGAIFLILANTVLGIGKDVQIIGIDWFVFAIYAWLFLFAYHLFNVFVTHKFMGKNWENQQLERLVAKQKKRIAQMKEQFIKEETLKAQSEAYSETHNKESKKKNELTIIAAAGENDAIGKDNKLIWHLKDDLKRFKALTSGHHLIMGRKTFESFSKPLPNRKHIVITNQENYTVPEGVLKANSLEKAIDLCKEDPQPFIIGGGEIYRQAMHFADKIELTRVHHEFDADTYFPVIDTAVWKETNNRFHDKNEDHEFAFSFITYIKR